ncbi:MAG: hypothetical protein ABSH46_15505 [Bryobacteraceae bacterium]
MTAQRSKNGGRPDATRVLREAPSELTRGALVRLGEGIGKVAYASEHWVVSRERHPSEILGLILTWKLLRKLDRLLPGKIGRRMLAKPGRQIRALSLMFQVLVLSVPRGIWFTRHARHMWRQYSWHETRGRRLADAHLAGTTLVPERVAFPPTRVKVGRWPGWLVVSEATERAETTLYERINELARARRFDEIELWLQRYLELRRAAWQRGVFSLDPHLKNYGVTADRVVLLDAGGLTNVWPEIAKRLQEDDLTPPHVRLGLEMTLRDRPDIADRFDAEWKAAVNPAAVHSDWQKHR